MVTSRLRRVFVTVRRIVAPALAAVLIAGVIGQAVRDRTAALAVLFYLPIVPVGILALVTDLAQLGRALSYGRFVLTMLGLFGLVIGAVPMVGLGAIHKGAGSQWSASVFQWNVQWGGGPFRSLDTWRDQRAQITRVKADIMILSEPPEASWLELLRKDLGPTASCVTNELGPATSRWFRMAVISEWPLQLERTMEFPGGHGMSVTATVQGRELRLLVVDGLSNPFQSRLPFLAAVSILLEREKAEGRPYDLVAGDFNTPARSIGFDEWDAMGYKLASRFAPGWRGTFPSWLPVYDIDHVWVQPALRVESCSMIAGVRSDHRGQSVRIKWENSR